MKLERLLGNSSVVEIDVITEWQFPFTGGGSELMPVIWSYEFNPEQRSQSINVHADAAWLGVAEVNGFYVLFAAVTEGGDRVPADAIRHH